MAIVSVQQMIALERAAIANGWSESSLMEMAGKALGHAIGRFYPIAGTAVGYLGKGHNAGDTLIALQVLQEHYGWRIHYRTAWPLAECASLVQCHAAGIPATCHERHPPAPSQLKSPLLLVDGLLGTGAKGQIRGPVLELTREIETLRNRHGASVAAVDIPSGVDGNTGHADKQAVTADVTFMIGNAKQGMMTEAAARHVGALALVPLAPLTLEPPTPTEILCPQTADFCKSPRPHDLHKGSAGKVGLICGSHAYPGAAALAATGALKSGAGLVTLHVPQGIRPDVATLCPPEVITCGYESITEIPHDSANAWVVGCGLSLLDEPSARDLFAWIEAHCAPTVIDADALNLIASHQRHDLLAPHHVITPHPGEFQRLAPDLAESPRESAARSFTDRHPATLLLKGTRSLITRSGAPLWINTSGCSGMASGGMGDLLAGTIGTMLAAGYPPLDATATSAWLCGRAAELCSLAQGHASDATTASDAARHLGAAINDWRQATR